MDETKAKRLIVELIRVETNVVLESKRQRGVTDRTTFREKKAIHNLLLALGAPSRNEARRLYSEIMDEVEG